MNGSKSRITISLDTELVEKLEQSAAANNRPIRDEFEAVIRDGLKYLVLMGQINEILKRYDEGSKNSMKRSGTRPKTKQNGSNSAALRE